MWSYDPENYTKDSYATDRASHARQVKGVDPDKKGYSKALCRGLGVTLTIPPRKNRLLQNLEEMKLGGYLGNDTKRFTKVCG